MIDTNSRPVELLDAASLFLYIATLDDIDQERQRMEAIYKRDLAVQEVNHPTHSGARCTRVTWRCL
jgi:hypothetical protein